ncbi:MAG: hypothetical protein DMG38_04000 [Acidobacteria bacterium]|nr:MAG: hypothetical protein DMG38_04000 [Acidobacteriota bacterium]
MCGGTRNGAERQCHVAGVLQGSRSWQEAGIVGAYKVLSFFWCRGCQGSREERLSGFSEGLDLQALAKRKVPLRSARRNSLLVLFL